MEQMAHVLDRRGSRDCLSEEEKDGNILTSVFI
jgi:hypothetical protein